VLESACSGHLGAMVRLGLMRCCSWLAIARGGCWVARPAQPAGGAGRGVSPSTLYGGLTRLPSGKPPTFAPFGRQPGIIGWKKVIGSPDYGILSLLQPVH